VALDRSRGWVATWRATFLPTLPHFAVAAVLGALLAGFAALGAAYLLVLGPLPSLSGHVTQLLTNSP